MDKEVEEMKGTAQIELTQAEVARIRYLLFQVSQKELRGNNRGYNRVRQVQAILARAERRVGRAPRPNRLLTDVEIINEIFCNEQSNS